MKLTQNQLNVLNERVVDGQAWADHVEATFDTAKAKEAMLAKVAKNQASYDEAVAQGNYKNRAVRESEIIDPSDQTKWTPMKRWKFAMKKQERMGGIDRDTENLITDNPALVINEYTQVKYDAKIKKRGERP